MMKRCRLTTAAFATLALLTSACHGRPSRVVFGVGMTASTHSAVRLAAEEINASGGIGGVPLELVGFESDGLQSQFDSASVIKLANRFVSTMDLVAVIGHSDSASTLSAAALYNKHRVPQLVTIATNPAITNIGTWTYRLCLSDAAQGPALAQYAVTDWKKRRIAVFYVNDDYGRGLARLFEQRVRGLGAEVVASVMHHNVLSDDDKQMIRSTLSGLKTGPRPDLFALFQRTAAGEWTAKAIREAGIEADMLGGDNLAQFGFARLDPSIVDGTRVSQFLQLDQGNPRAAAFARSFRARAGSDPDYSQAFAYDAVYLLRDAVLSGGYSREGVKAYLDRLIAERTLVHGVAGVFTFGTDHDARRPFYIAEIRNREFHVVKALAVK